jgi:hypothetical protein
MQELSAYLCSLQAHVMISHVESYIKDHPEVAIIDPLDNVRTLLDRYRSYSIIHNSDLEKAGKQGNCCSIFMSCSRF